jgi:hypothetical protein
MRAFNILDYILSVIFLSFIFGLLGIFTLYISEFTTLGMNVVFCMFN